MNAKLDTARVFERAFKIYGDQFTLFVPAALILFVPVALLNGWVLADGSGPALALTSLIAVIATFWFTGVIVEAARDIVDGRRDHTIGSLLESAWPVILPLLGASILAGIAIAIGLLLLLAPGLFLLTIWAVIVPAIVIERLGVLDSFGRSRELVRGNGWQVFGVVVVMILLQLMLTVVVQAIVGGATGESFAGYALADLVIRVLIAPLIGIAATVMYLELRRVKGEPLPEEGGTVGPLPPQEAPPRGPEAPA